MKTYQDICTEVIRSFWLVPHKFRKIVQNISKMSLTFEDYTYIKTQIRNTFTDLYLFAVEEQDGDSLKRIRRAFRDNPELLEFVYEPNGEIRRYFEELQEYESHRWEKERMFGLPDFLFTQGYDPALEKEADAMIYKKIVDYRISYSSILEAKKLYIKGNISLDLFYEKLARYIISQMFYLGTEYRYTDGTPNLTYLIRCKKHHIRTFSRQTTVELSALRQGYVHLRDREERTPGFKKTYFNLLKDILDTSLTIAAARSCRGFHSYPSEWFSDYSFLFQETCYACLETNHVQIKVFKPCNHFVCSTCSSNPQCNLARCGMCRQSIQYVVDVI